MTGDTQDTPKGKHLPNGWRKVFLKSLAKTGNVKASAKVARVARLVAYRHKSRDPKFAAAWDNAIESATDSLEAEARRRAVKGMLKPVFYQGEECGSVREYSDRLLMFLLKAYRPERFRDNFSVQKFLAELDAQRSLADQPPPAAPPGDRKPDGP